jgi:pimeloyl-ACP methyl ester carboxylesterase
MLATPLETATLPPGIRSRFVRGVNGLDIHILEAGYAPAGRPLVLLLHGFPEIAYSWRKVMPALAEAGFHAVAPDQRGYGRTTGWSPDFDTDLRPWRTLNAVRDALGLVAALGHRSIHAVVGNDFGAGIAAWCALVRPDVFRSLALMTPFGGPPDLPFATDGKEPAPPATPTIHEALEVRSTKKPLRAHTPSRHRWTSEIPRRLSDLPARGVLAHLRGRISVEGWSIVCEPSG